MEEKLDLLLLDNSNLSIEEINFIKPSTYNELLSIIEKALKKLPKYYNIYYLDDNGNEIIINNDEKYKLAKNIIYIREADNLEESEFSLNYNKLSESKKKDLDDKYSCNICQGNIKNIKDDKPTICYQCQKTFHRKCLEIWDNTCRQRNVRFNCPHCKYNLPLKDWKQKKNYEDERKNEANIMSEFNKYKMKDNLNNNINRINKNNYNELKKQFRIYRENNSKISKRIIEINNIIAKSNKLGNNKNEIEFNGPYEMPVQVFKCLDNIENFVKEKINSSFKEENNIQNLEKKEIINIREKKQINDNKKEEKFNNRLKKDEIIDDKNNRDLEEELNNIKDINSNDVIKKNTFIDNYIIAEAEIKNYNESIELIKSEFLHDIKDIEIKSKPGDRFVFLNTHNSDFRFRIKGNYIIKYIFKKVLNNVKYMFSLCKSLTKINLSNFNSENITDMTGMFYGCQSLTNINFSNFNTKNVTNMNYMFHGCSSLVDLNLSNFITEKVTDLSNMFTNCFSLTNVNFFNCNTKNVITMDNMFLGCHSLVNIDLSNFITDNLISIKGMFTNCKSLKNVNLSNWNTKNVTNMDEMFYQCESLVNLDLPDFITENVISMSGLFKYCKSLMKINLSSFNTKNVNDMQEMFKGCKLLNKRNVITKDDKIINEINMI